MIHILKDKELVADIFASEFDSRVPEGGQGDVVAIVGEGQIKSFLMVEHLVRAGLLWVAPQYRNTPEAAKMMRQLARFVYYSIPQGQSGILIDSDGTFGELFTKLGFRKVEGTVYRKDF